jgi:hypothetical protein
MCEEDWCEMLDKATYKNYLDKLSELEEATGRKYSVTNNTWRSAGDTDRNGYVFMETNTLFIKGGIIKYTKHDAMGYIKESFEISIGEHRNTQLEKVLDAD